MSPFRILLAGALLALTGCQAAPDADPAKPDAYAVQLPVEPATGGGVQRIDLPVQALVASQRADLGDVRLFDARGRQMSLARVGPVSVRSGTSRAVRLYPVVGSLTPVDGQALSVRIEQGATARVVTLDASAPVAPASGGAVLLDTRDVSEPVRAIRLAADIPVGQPVMLTLKSSEDLSDWQLLTEQVLFRGEGIGNSGGEMLAGGTIRLAGADLRGRYVAVSWTVRNVRLTGAEVDTSVDAAPARLSVGTDGLVLEDGHHLRFAVPTNAPLAAIRLRAAQGEGVLPLRLYGRRNAEQPWVGVSAGTLRPGDAGLTLDVGGIAFAQYRIEADRRTSGFSTPPPLELLFDPVAVIADMSGTPPYRLAVGQAAAEAVWLNAADLAPAGKALPVAKVAVPAGSAPLVTLGPGESDGPLAPRKLALWGALLLGVVVLGFIAWRLVRGLPQPPVDSV